MTPPSSDRVWGVEVHDLQFERPGGAFEPFRMACAHLSIRSDPTLIGAGQRIPIMGPSGAGKSTLMNLLAGLTFPQGPKARIEWSFPDGRRFSWGRSGPRPGDLVPLRQTYFGFAFQAANLLPHLTVGENIMLALEAKGLSPRAAREVAMERLSGVFGDDGIVSKIMDRYDGQVSGGQRQRIALVQSMIHDPHVLFADEPTGSLDSETRRTVMGVLRDWLNEPGTERLLLWVTHHDDDPGLMEADRVLYVCDHGVSWRTAAPMAAVAHG